MNVILKQTFRIGILAFCLSSSLTLADSAEEMERADDFYNKANMMDAAVIFRKLALENHLPAQTRLGDLLDYTEAHEVAVGWYIMAAFQGNAAGAYNLGRMYLAGQGIKKDPEQALYWLNFSADKDNLNAVSALENGYRKGAISGLPISVDLGKAEFWKAKKIPLVAAEKKAFDEKVEAERKARKEKADATKKADEEAAKRKAGGKSR